jgi:opacity protein-like surface antigen
MRRSLALILPFGLALQSLATPAAAQTTGVAKFEIGALPVGVVIFTDGDGDAPGFANYALAGTFTFNVSKFIGIEGEFGGTVGVTQDLDFATGTVSGKPPSQISYSGNVVYHIGGVDRTLVPYVIGGAGGLRNFARAVVGVPEDTDLFVLNVGGGVKVRVSDRWGVRADYRFLTALSADGAPPFFGGSGNDRFGHRLAGGLTFDFGR